MEKLNFSCSVTSIFSLLSFPLDITQGENQCKYLLVILIYSSFLFFYWFVRLGRNLKICLYDQHEKIYIPYMFHFMNKYKFFTRMIVKRLYMN
ncbi:hypothetical protein CQP30_17685 [Yersinia pestis]|uniref:Uncharacterized protein n=1 Tax=Yersinia pseudotuberculosis TaxID=633 RepID=A0ABN5R7V6_YERPU|nr:hypothetical protein EGX47_13350 [Yersinia pseudotuberculosis]AYX18852.1 hypothetical protein EGX46_05295 [Yersinia pestis]OSZ85340.1 hypothetical protein A7722_18255 [Yersinia pestis subsp. microtus bv. Caucasica]OUY87962.1 hypothetical protein BFI44_19175 [Yersinia pestis subsp. microtus bv. Altaica]QFR86305.1 hypothetical protein DJY80_16200 [Yersinia pestis subsp. pestis bv. Medievalis]